MNGRDGDRPRPRRPFFENEGLISVKSNFAKWNSQTHLYVLRPYTYFFILKNIVNDNDIEGSWDVGRQNGRPIRKANLQPLLLRLSNLNNDLVALLRKRLNGQLPERFFFVCSMTT